MHQAGPENAKNLRYVWHKDVKDEVTQLLCRQIMVDDKESWDTLPGSNKKQPLIQRFDDAKEYAFDDEEGFGRVLIASPNGRGLAWLLIQHKEELGAKRIAGVRMFADDDVTLGNMAVKNGLAFPHGSFHLLFRLEDVPEQIHQQQQ